MPKDRVKVQLGRVINLGNYESFRADAGFETDVKSDETRKQAYERAKTVTGTMLNDLCAPVEEALGKKENRRKEK